MLAEMTEININEIITSDPNRVRVAVETSLEETLKDPRLSEWFKEAAIKVASDVISEYHGGLSIK